MAFDALMARAVTRELKANVVGAKTEKIYQPSKDEIIISLRVDRRNVKLVVSANPSSARVSLTGIDRENPQTPPMFCMLLRKHLAGTTVEDVYMYGFERIIEIKFKAYDELGFPTEKYLTTEIMGKSSNIFLLGGNEKKILGVLHPGDITTPSKRRVIVGAPYELPPAQDKVDPNDETEESFTARLGECEKERTVEKYIVGTYLGISPLIAREIAYRAGKADAVGGSSPRMLWRAFSEMVKTASEGATAPCAVVCGDTPKEYSYIQIYQYDNSAKTVMFTTFSEMFDFYFGEREHKETMRAKAHDIEAILSSGRKKLTKKLTLMREELSECDEAEKYKLWGDLITASIYLLTKKTDSATVTNNNSENIETVTVPLDIKLTPSQNAARYYKKYNKLKTAKKMLAEQIEKAERELSYFETVETSLSMAENEADIYEIRIELAEAGYSQKRSSVGKARSHAKFEPKHYVTSGGYDVYVGKNNIQNDLITTKYSKKSDWWFHVKNAPGSHVVMICDADDEPPAQDFTEAAQLAAFWSSRKDGENVAVDYTKIRNVKKPSGAAPGYVIYSSNYTAYVDPKCECKEI